MPEYVDTHTHLYLEQFDEDRVAIIDAAFKAGVNYMLLPNVDMDTVRSMMRLHEKYPDQCIPMMALHPTSVKESPEELLDQAYQLLKKYSFCAIGETGIDLYWDKSNYLLQLMAFDRHIQWALELDLPLVIHARSSTDEIRKVLEPYKGYGLKGVMHCFPGNREQADWFLDFGFLLGIGGVVTYKKSEMANVVAHVPLESLLLETDAPYLPPVPYRGKRNEPAYIPLIAAKIAEIKGVSVDQVARVTTSTAKDLFGLK